MADASIEQRIIEKLRQLDDTAKLRVLDFIEHATDEDDEAEWEEHVLNESLGDALRADGSLDYEKLRRTGKVMTLDELYPEGEEDDGA